MSHGLDWYIRDRFKQLVHEPPGIPSDLSLVVKIKKGDLLMGYIRAESPASARPHLRTASGLALTFTFMILRSLDFNQGRVIQRSADISPSNGTEERNLFLVTKVYGENVVLLIDGNAITFNYSISNRKGKEKTKFIVYRDTSINES